MEVHLQQCIIMEKVVNKTSTPIGERYLPNAIIVEKVVQFKKRTTFYNFIKEQ